MAEVSPVRHLVRGNTGRPIAGGTPVRVLTTAGAAATVYSDAAGVTVAAQPLYADNKGYVNFYASAGDYDVAAFGGSYTPERISLGGTQNTTSVLGAAVVLADATLADRFTAALVINATYEWEATLVYIVPAADDAQVKVNVPASTTGGFVALGQTSALAAAVTTGVYGTAITVGGNDATQVVLRLSGIAKTAATAGNLALQFAKAADAGADGSLLAGLSFLRVRRIA